MKPNPRLNEALGNAAGSEPTSTNKVDRMAHARGHRGGNVPAHKLTGSESLQKQIADASAVRETAMRERAAAASEREARNEEAKSKLTREQQLKEAFIKAKLIQGSDQTWKTFTVREWEAMDDARKRKFIFQRTTEPNNYHQLSARVRNSGSKSTVVHTSLSPPRRFYTLKESNK